MSLEFAFQIMLLFLMGSLNSFRVLSQMSLYSRNNKNGIDNESFAVLTVQKYLHFEKILLVKFSQHFFLFNVLSVFQSLTILFSEPIIQSTFALLVRLCTKQTYLH